MSDAAVFLHCKKLDSYLTTFSFSTRLNMPFYTHPGLQSAVSAGYIWQQILHKEDDRSRVNHIPFNGNTWSYCCRSISR